MEGEEGELRGSLMRISRWWRGLQILRFVSFFFFSLKLPVLYCTFLFLLFFLATLCFLVYSILFAIIYWCATGKSRLHIFLSQVRYHAKSTPPPISPTLKFFNIHDLGGLQAQAMSFLRKITSLP